jgi:hypothetical protein
MGTRKNRDAKSANSSATCATEDAELRRQSRPRGETSFFSTLLDW